MPTINQMCKELVILYYSTANDIQTRTKKKKKEEGDQCEMAGK